MLCADGPKETCVVGKIWFFFLRNIPNSTSEKYYLTNKGVKFSGSSCDSQDEWKLRLKIKLGIKRPPADKLCRLPVSFPEWLQWNHLTLDTKSLRRVFCNTISHNASAASELQLIIAFTGVRSDSEAA